VHQLGPTLNAFCLILLIKFNISPVHTSWGTKIVLVAASPGILTLVMALE
jgi:hypothetical protein